MGYENRNCLRCGKVCYGRRCKECVKKKGVWGDKKEINKYLLISGSK